MDPIVFIVGALVLGFIAGLLVGGHNSKQVADGVSALRGSVSDLHAAVGSVGSAVAEVKGIASAAHATSVATLAATPPAAKSPVNPGATS